MKPIFKLEEAHEWTLERIVEYMENTPEDSWCTEVVRTKDGKNCFYGHLFDMGGGDTEGGGGSLWDYFEEAYATTFMLYPVNDGRHPDYPQATPKQRCIAYLRDLISGKKETTAQLLEEEAERYAKAKTKNDTTIRM